MRTIVLTCLVGLSIIVAAAITTAARRGSQHGDRPDRSRQLLWVEYLE